MSRRTKATALFSVALFGALLSSVFTEPGFWNKAFGPTVSGLPTPVFVGSIVTLLYLPVPWFAWHATGIVLRGHALGMSLEKWGILHMFLTIGHRVPELRRSQAVVAVGVAYFIVLVAAWIWYTDSRGI